MIFKIILLKTQKKCKIHHIIGLLFFKISHYFGAFSVYVGKLSFAYLCCRQNKK